MKLMQFIYGVKLVGASLLVLMLAFLFAASLIQKTDLFQLGHLQRAVEYVREHKKSTGVIPNSNDFNRWKRNMDSEPFVGRARWWIVGLTGCYENSFLRIELKNDCVAGIALKKAT